jgi:hypothetical protein
LLFGIFWVIWYLYFPPFWYVVPIKIWQPCTRGDFINLKFPWIFFPNRCPKSYGQSFILKLCTCNNL